MGSRYFPLMFGLWHAEGGEWIAFDTHRDRLDQIIEIYGAHLVIKPVEIHGVSTEDQGAVSDSDSMAENTRLRAVADAVVWAEDQSDLQLIAALADEVTRLARQGADLQTEIERLQAEVESLVVVVARYQAENARLQAESDAAAKRLYPVAVRLQNISVSPEWDEVRAACERDVREVQNALAAALDGRPEEAS